MMMKYESLKAYPKIFLRATGLHLSEFDALYADVEAAFLLAESKRLSRANRQRASGGGLSPDLEARDQILLTLLWLRLYPVHDLLGYFFGISQPTVGRYLGRVLPVLEAAGQDTMRLPDPGRKRRKQLPELLKDLPELGIIIDSFEQKVQKPREQEEADSYYSRKKKAHTLKSQIAVHPETGYIAAISQSVKGRTADMTLLKDSQLLDEIPAEMALSGDKGYQGIAKLRENGFSPRKKPWGKDKPLSEADKDYNRAFSQHRIIVENSINRLRRYQALKQTDRQHRKGHEARVVAVAGLVNRQLAARMPL